MTSILKNNAVRYWIPVFFVFSLIFYLSSIPQDDLPVLNFPFQDKIAHILMYSGLGFVIARALTAHMRENASWKRYRVQILISVILTLIYGIFDEYHQSFTPGRNVELLDLVADAVGGFLGGLSCIYYRHFVGDYEKKYGPLA